MDFSLTDEQSLLLESVDEFCERYFTDDVVKEMYETNSMPVEIAEAYRDAGFGLLGMPEEYGGIPADKLTMGLMIERMYHKSGCMHILYQNSLTMSDIMEFGNEEQKQMCMDYYMETGWPIGSLAISEPAAGSDNSAIATVTVKQPDGTYKLNGQKTWITMGETLPYTIVVAKDEDPAYENGNMSLWLVKMDAPGVSTAPLHKIGQQCIPFCEVYLDDVILTEDQRMGEPGKGFKMLMKNFELERPLIMCEQLGLAQAALEDAARYATQRIAFGKPIYKLEMIQELLADMEAKVQTSRYYTYKVLWMIDEGQDVRLDSALVKRYAAKALYEVCDMAMQVYAGLGYTTETRVGRLWADTRGNMFGGGTHEIMAYIAGRQVAKKYAE